MDRYKIIILGPANSGKTTILNQIKGDYNQIPDLYIPTIGVDLGCKSINIKDKEVKIQFWDTAGQERFDSIVSLFYKKANMAFIVFDISDINTNFSIDSLIEKIYLQSGEIPIILIGNKKDKVGDYNSKSISKYKIDIDEFDKITQYFEISALNSDDVNNMFNIILENEIIRYIETENNTIYNQHQSILIEKPNRKKNIFKYCCPLFK
tara:strand:+ start:448 stop:1071 length:624 start_codon:yes stop_codon:yes gene_type:complete